MAKDREDWKRFKETILETLGRIFQGEQTVTQLS